MKKSVKDIPKRKAFARSMRIVSMNSEEMLAREIIKKSAKNKMTRAKMKLRLLHRLKHNI